MKEKEQVGVQLQNWFCIGIHGKALILVNILYQLCSIMRCLSITRRFHRPHLLCKHHHHPKHLTLIHLRQLLYKSRKVFITGRTCIDWFYFILSLKGDRLKFPATPPPRKKNQVVGGTPILSDFPLTKSTSHESQLANRVDNSDVPRFVIFV